jgi:hypothetical protein
MWAVSLSAHGLSSLVVWLCSSLSCIDLKAQNTTQPDTTHKALNRNVFMILITQIKVTTRERNINGIGEKEEERERE